jgi:CRP-like cAMP-binding protein
MPPFALQVEERCVACRLGRAARGRCPFEETTIPAGTALYHQGDVPQAVWAVRRGQVLLSSLSADGEETWCALRGADALVGLEALAERPATHEAWALSEVTVCRIDAWAFRAWVGGDDTPAGAVLALTLEESERRERERGALTGRALERVARLLAAGADPHIEQRLLARLLGMRAETFSRALARLRAVGAIGEGPSLRVRDAAALARAVAEDARLTPAVDPDQAAVVRRVARR